MPSSLHIPPPVSDPYDSRYILYVLPNDNNSIRALQRVPEKARVFVQNIAKIPSAKRPEWLNGAPILVNHRKRIIFKGVKRVCNELDKYGDLLDVARDLLPPPTAVTAALVPPTAVTTASVSPIAPLITPTTAAAVAAVPNTTTAVPNTTTASPIASIATTSLPTTSSPPAVTAPHEPLSFRSYFGDVDIQSLLTSSSDRSVIRSGANAVDNNAAATDSSMLIDSTATPREPISREPTPREPVLPSVSSSLPLKPNHAPATVVPNNSKYSFRSKPLVMPPPTPLAPAPTPTA